MLGPHDTWQGREKTADGILSQVFARFQRISEKYEQLRSCWDDRYNGADFQREVTQPLLGCIEELWPQCCDSQDCARIPLIAASLVVDSFLETLELYMRGGKVGDREASGDCMDDMTRNKVEHDFLVRVQSILTQRRWRATLAEVRDFIFWFYNLIVTAIRPHCTSGDCTTAATMAWESVFCTRKEQTRGFEQLILDLFFEYREPRGGEMLSRGQLCMGLLFRELTQHRERTARCLQLTHNRIRRPYDCIIKKQPHPENN